MFLGDHGCSSYRQGARSCCGYSGYFYKILQRVKSLTGKEEAKCRIITPPQTSLDYLLFRMLGGVIWAATCQVTPQMSAK